ncbi:TolB family protein [Bryobacter aggregatus]|uniref:TolB family protein n=1 Tax=Bryobacter aggregatus TaxID=360054 RepID=UPI0004E17691|nr:PD40 domain-containing protein [Bryobacter aggregatus]
MGRISFLLSIVVTATAIAQEGRIVYTKFDGLPPWHSDLYRMNGDGSERVALTRDGQSRNPRWSPDGKRIVFVQSFAMDSSQLVVMDADGKKRQVLARMSWIGSATWSPDGSSFAMVARTPSLATLSQDPIWSGLYLLPANGKGKLRLLFPSVATASWSPDGKKIAFAKEGPRGQWSVWVSLADGTGDLRLTAPEPDLGNVAWSPDGAWISAQTEGKIFVIREDGRGRKAVPMPRGWLCRSTAWTPDARHLVASCSAGPVGCGGPSSTGQILPPCELRLFRLPLDGKSAAVRLGDPQAREADVSLRE